MREKNFGRLIEGQGGGGRNYREQMVSLREQDSVTVVSLTEWVWRER